MLGSKLVTTESMSETSRKMTSLTKRDKTQKNRKAVKTLINFRINSMKDSHDKSSRKVNPGLRQTDPKQRNNHKALSSNSPKGRVGPDASSKSPVRRVGLRKSSNSPNKQSDSPVRRVGSTSLPSSCPRSSLLRDWIEPALVSSR